MSEAHRRQQTAETRRQVDGATGVSAQHLRLLGHSAHKYTAQEAEVVSELTEAFESSPLSVCQRLAAFPKYVRRQDLARFLAKWELFKLVLGVHGSIVECGVFTGGGLFAWYHFSAISEPYNHTRRIIGFDTFRGFPGLSERDQTAEPSGHHSEGAFFVPMDLLAELRRLAKIHDQNRPLGHIPKIVLVEGDARLTIAEFLRTNPHLLISLLYLDFDLYEPTKVALEMLLPRVVKGGVVAFDELNTELWPGETSAFLETVGVAELRRTSLDPHISYFVR